MPGELIIWRTRTSRKKRAQSNSQENKHSKKPKDAREDPATKILRVEKEKQAANILSYIKISIDVESVPSGTTENVVSKFQLQHPNLNISKKRVQNHIQITTMIQQWW